MKIRNVALLSFLVLGACAKSGRHSSPNVVTTTTTTRAPEIDDATAFNQLAAEVEADSHRLTALNEPAMSGRSSLIDIGWPRVVPDNRAEITQLLMNIMRNSETQAALARQMGRRDLLKRAKLQRSRAEYRLKTMN